MSKQLYAVPFTFTYAGKLMVAADSPEDAREQAEGILLVDEGNIGESCVFYDPCESGRIAEAKCVGPELGEVAVSSADPEEFGLGEELELELEVEEEECKTCGEPVSECSCEEEEEEAK